MTRSFIPSAREPREQRTVDAAGKTLGRLASEVALLLRGKHRATYTPNADAGAAVRVVHLRAVRFTGTKQASVGGKTYHRYSMYPGGLKTETLRTRWARAPERVLRDAVSGMLPPNRLRQRMLKRLSASQ